MKLTSIDDAYVNDMLEGLKNNIYLRNGLCGADLRNIDMSNLSVEMFKKLSFDENTIFSDEQINKFKPFELLERAKLPQDNVLKLHENGITGKGITIAIIDTNLECKNKLFESSDIEFNITENAGEKEVHGATVLSAFLSIAPDAKVRYYANNKRDKNVDENIMEYIQDIITKGDVQLVSISSSFKDEKIREKVCKLLKENDIELIDSSEFYKNFTYCTREFDKNGEEKFTYSFVEEETITEEEYLIKKEKINDLLNEYGVKDKNLNILREKLLEDGKEEFIKELAKYKNTIFFEKFEGENGYLHQIKQKTQDNEMIERIKNDSIEFPCGGKTFIGDKGKYKYFSTCSASYTIPQVAGMYSLAKQKCKDLNIMNL